MPAVLLFKTVFSFVSSASADSLNTLKIILGMVGYRAFEKEHLLHRVPMQTVNIKCW